MADPTTPTPCDEVADDLELHVLGALEPDEDARVVAHLAGCATCRARVDALTAALGELLTGVPPAEVPPGFTDGVVGVASPAPAADVAALPARQGRRRGVRWAAAAAVVLLVAAGLLALGSWWASSSSDTADVAVPDRWAPLFAVGGPPIGSVSLTAGSGQVDLSMALDAAPVGVPYECVVRTFDGREISVGSWTTTEAGPATWSVGLPAGTGPVEEVLLVVPGTGTIATARPT